MLEFPRLRHEDCGLEASLRYMKKPYLEITNTQHKIKSRKRKRSKEERERGNRPKGKAD